MAPVSSTKMPPSQQANYNPQNELQEVDSDEVLEGQKRETAIHYSQSILTVSALNHGVGGKEVLPS